MNRTDRLNFAIFVLHGDCCNCTEGDCASGFSRKDYVLSAKFSYLLEALDVIEKWNNRGVNCRLRSPRYGTCDFDWSEYPAKGKATVLSEAEKRKLAADNGSPYHC